MEDKEWLHGHLKVSLPLKPGPKVSAIGTPMAFMPSKALSKASSGFVPPTIAYLPRDRAAKGKDIETLSANGQVFHPHNWH